jgi:hypothetical protein
MAHSILFAVVLMVGSMLGYILAECGAWLLFSYFGAAMAWLLSFGCIRLEPLRRGGGELTLSYSLGLIFTLLFVIGACGIFQHP